MYSSQNGKVDIYSVESPRNKSQLAQTRFKPAPLSYVGRVSFSGAASKNKSIPPAGIESTAADRNPTLCAFTSSAILVTAAFLLCPGRRNFLALCEIKLRSWSHCRIHHTLIFTVFHKYIEQFIVYHLYPFHLKATLKIVVA